MPEPENTPDGPQALSTGTTEAREQAAAKPNKCKKYGGRQKGAVNKRTLDKLRGAEIEVSAARHGKKLAIDHMDEMIDYFRGLVALHQPWNADGTRREGRDEKLWFRCVDAFKAFLSLRAPYQSPTLSAVAIMPVQAHQQRTTVNVTILNERGDKVYSDADHAEPKLIEHDDEAA